MDGTTQDSRIVDRVKTIIDNYRTFVMNLLDMTDAATSHRRTELHLDLMRAIEDNRLDYDKLHDLLTGTSLQVDSFHKAG